MQRHSVRRLLVNALEDIDFAIVGPVWSYCPECRPSSADRIRHVPDVGNYETMIVRFLARKTNAGPAPPGTYASIIYSHIYGIVVGVDEAHILRGPFGYVVNVTVRRITRSEEVKHAKECGWGIIVLENIASYAEVDQGRTDKE